jgi:aminopeptidase N
VRAIARDLTLQPGVPLLVEGDARCVAGRTEVTLAQRQFVVNGRAAGRWRMPVRLAVLGGGSVQALIEGPALQRVRVPGCGSLVINAGQSSYARVQYSAAGLAALTRDFATLGVDDQLGLLADTQALAYAGRLDMGALMALLGRVTSGSDTLVQQALVDQLVGLDTLYDGLPTQPRFRERARQWLRPLFDRDGWAETAELSGQAATLRASLIQALGRLDDRGVTSEVESRFAHFLADPRSLHGDLREAVLGVVALRAGDARWDELHALATKAGSPLEKAGFYELLGSTRDPALARRALELALSGEPPATMASALLRDVARAHPALALEFIDAHWRQVEPLFGDAAAAVIAARFFDTGADAALAVRLHAFVQARVPAATRGQSAKNEALIRDRASVRTQRLPSADRWIAQQPA